MPAELRWLIFTALLAGTLWVPYIIGINVTDFPGKDELFVRPPDLSKMKAWVHRSWRVHQNILEQLLPYSIVVLAGAVSHASTPVTEWCAILFFCLRVTHAALTIPGLARLPLRPMIYLAGWAVMLVHAWQVLRYARAA